MGQTYLLIAFAIGAVAVLGLFFRNIFPQRPRSQFRADPRTYGKPQKESIQEPFQLPTRFPQSHQSAYEILGLEKLGITKDLVLKASRQRLLEFHPDRFAQGTPDEQAQARMSTELILRAREELLRSFK